MKIVHVTVRNLKINTTLSFEMKMTINNHGYAHFVGIIDEEEEKNCAEYLLSQQWVTIEGIEESGEKIVLFAGVIFRYSIECINRLFTLDLELSGGTVLLDVQKNTKTFQNVGLSYDELYRIVDSSVGARHLMFSGNGSIGKFTVQYEETDWEFIKRMASRKNTCVIPCFNEEKVQYYIGMGGKNTKDTIVVSEYKKERVLNEFYYKRKEKTSEYGKINTPIWSFTSREFAKLGDKISLNGEELYIYEVVSKFVGQELVNSYEARTTEGFRVKTFENYTVVGASFDGTVTAVQKEHVQISMPTDVAGNSIWFDYATVYSSPDGAGWYCMPEVGDSIKLYCPSEDTQKAYVLNGVHINSNDRTDPTKKSWKNVFNKQIELSEDAIKITNNKGMTVILDDKKGISIVSDKNIYIEGEKGVEIVSDTDSIVMEAPKKIKLEQGCNSVVLNNEISVTGSEVKLQ